MILSILIPTIPSRGDMLNLLLKDVEFQKGALEFPDEIEVLIDNDLEFLNGGKSIGKKRNDLVQKATGKYLCFLDDDDIIAPNYLAEIIKATETGKDCYTFNSLFKNDFYFAFIQMSFLNKENEQASPNGIIKRAVWHICPVLSSIAKTEEFENINSSEDWDWMQRVLPKLKTSDHIDMILHQYNHYESISESDKILKDGHK